MLSVLAAESIWCNSIGSLSPGKAIAVSCRIDGNKLSVQAAGKALKPLEARGLGSLVGQVVFRAQGGRLAIDDFVTRQSETDGE